MASSKASVQEESHDKNRLKVCVVCYRKGKRLLSDREVENVRSYVIDDYDINNSYFPAGICDGCHLLLNKKAKYQVSRYRLRGNDLTSFHAIIFNIFMQLSDVYCRNI